jgi:hypothetical protein
VNAGIRAAGKRGGASAPILHSPASSSDLDGGASTGAPFLTGPHHGCRGGGAPRRHPTAHPHPPDRRPSTKVGLPVGGWVRTSHLKIRRNSLAIRRRRQVETALLTKTVAIAA